MKKILFKLIFGGAFLFIFILNSQADGGGRNVTFTYDDNSYSYGVTTYENGRSVINVHYESDLTKLSAAQLAEILSQSSSTGAGSLAVYADIIVNVKPVAGSNYDTLKNKTSVYQGISEGVWQDSLSVSIDESETAVLKTLKSDYFPYLMKAYYRETTDDEWIRTTSFPQSESKTLENQLASLLSIDLEATPNGVKEAYNELYYFEPLDESDVLTTRFDFYDTKDGTTPTLATGSTDHYLVNSLKHLGSEYLVIKFHAPTATTAVEINNETESNNFIKISLISILLLGLGVGTFYIKKNNLFNLE